jgi:predicted amidophosphoribosyltransferase
VDGENIVRAGNGVFTEAQALGLKVRVVDARRDELIAVRRKDLKGKAAIQAAMLDNLAADSSAREYDADILAAIARDDDVVAQLVNDDSQIAALVRGVDKREEAVDAGGDIEKLFVLRQKVNTRKDIVFFSVRAWRKCRKSDAIDFFKSKKLKRDAKFVRAVSSEISKLINAMFGRIEIFITTPAQRHSVGYHLATDVCRAVADNRGCEFVKLFEDNLTNGVSDPRNYKSIRATLLTTNDNKHPDSRVCVLIDDVATSGETIFQHLTTLRGAGIKAVAIVWIYEDAEV